NTMFNQEGGVDREEAHWEVLVDRVNTTATVWLGSTLACAQCHNHKYDPFTQKEFYQFMAFFSNTQWSKTWNGELPFVSAEPKLEMPAPEQESQRKELATGITRLEQRMKEDTTELAVAQERWEKRILSAAQDWTLLEVTRLRSRGGSTLVRLADSSVLAEGENPERDAYEIEATAPLSTLTAFRLEALPDTRLPRGGPGRDPYGNFWLSDFEVEIVGTDRMTRQPLKLRSVVDDSGRTADNGTIKKKTLDDGSHPWLIDASREEVRLPRQAVFILEKPGQVQPGTTLNLTLKHESEFSKQGIGRFRLSTTDRTDPETIVGIPATSRPLLSVPADKRSGEQTKELNAFYRTVAPPLEPARKQLAELRKELESLNIVSTLVLEERPSFERPSTHLRIRGSFLSKGEQVFASVPSVLQPLAADQMPNRLGLARWLVSEDNPLTARVTINRIWEQYFSHGLVETSEDFGTQGERPTHPELLDWLATEFMAQKWSLKSMHRLIVTSATYHQSSSATPVLLDRDPYNRLLARGPRFRMEAEMIRDVALSVSGLLSSTIGGPSVFSPQPEGIWDLPYNDDQWVVSEGADRYRRGLYTFMRRTSPYPSFTAFDAPSREFCTVRRVRTNTPMQALTLLNDPAFFEAARTLALRIMTEGGPRDEERAAHAFRICLSRHPKPDELMSLVTWYKRELVRFKQDPEAASKIIGPQVPASSAAVEAETAAWTMVSNVLLNLDEVISKE
ncbi:MAG: DUF1553 domain-containing protein, partial [Acidobacteria bacterium]|nr:DUF1553 domain-containing protein [Acidobacteriota bacterium]